MIVIDTSALIAIFRLEPEADALLKAIVAARKRAMSALSVLEASMVMSGARGTTGTGVMTKPGVSTRPGAVTGTGLSRELGESADRFEPLDAFLIEAGIEIVPFDAEQAWLAREAFLRFGKGRHKASLNLGDCVSYAAAKAKAAPLLYKGEDFRHTDLLAVLP